MINLKTLVKKARKDGYAIPHFNCNNPDWIRVVLRAAQKLKSPIIISGVEDQVKWMAGSYTTWLKLINDLIKENNITVPVVAHLDHGKYEECVNALKNGVKSIMFDGSNLSFHDNLIKTKKLIKLAKEQNASIEAEVGSIGGEEAGKITQVELADIDECVEMVDAGIDLLTAGIGNIHGEYPKNWKSLDFDLLNQISKNTNNFPLTLHGGSGIPDEQISKAISLGISKINVHTEVLIGFVNGMVNDVKHNNYEKVRAPQKLFSGAHREMTRIIEGKIILFNSNNKA